MPRGGKRENAGRKPGSRTRPKFALTAAAPADTAAAKPTPAQKMAIMRRQVALCIADGMNADKIAAIMGLPLAKLRAVFAHELEHGREIIRAEELLRLDSASADGKVSASRIILETAGGDRPSGTKADEDNSENAKITRMALKVLNGGKDA